MRAAYSRAGIPTARFWRARTRKSWRIGLVGECGTCFRARPTTMSLALRSRQTPRPHLVGKPRLAETIMARASGPISGLWTIRFEPRRGHTLVAALARAQVHPAYGSLCGAERRAVQALVGAPALRARATASQESRTRIGNVSLMPPEPIRRGGIEWTAFPHRLRKSEQSRQLPTVLAWRWGPHSGYRKCVEDSAGWCAPCDRRL